MNSDHNPKPLEGCSVPLLNSGDWMPASAAALLVEHHGFSALASRPSKPQLQHQVLLYLPGKMFLARSLMVVDREWFMRLCMCY